MLSKSKNRKGLTKETIIVLILGLIVLIVFLLSQPNLLKNITNSIFDVSDGLFQKTPSGAELEISSDSGSTTVNSDVKDSSVSTFSGTVAERAVAAAKDAGLDRQGAEIVLKLISQESQFRHCCITSGKNVAGNCKPSSDFECGFDKLLLSYDGSSVGAMQINKKVHKTWFTTDDTLCSDPKYKSECLIEQKAGCTDKTALNIDCNLKLGIRLLIANKNQFGRGKSFDCYSVHATYTGWDAALRAYNGWGCVDRAQSTYVSDVSNRDISAFKNLLDSAYPSG